MAAVELDDVEWQQVIAILATAPWRDVNPLLMKIGDQLRRAQAAGDAIMREKPPMPARMRESK